VLVGIWVVGAVAIPAEGCITIPYRVRNDPDMKDTRHGLLVKIGARPPMRCRVGVPLHGLPATTTTLHVRSTGCYGRCAVSRLAADMSPALERVGG
jgi:hypothetical protein